MTEVLAYSYIKSNFLLVQYTAAFLVRIFPNERGHGWDAKSKSINFLNPHQHHIRCSPPPPQWGTTPFHPILYTYDKPCCKKWHRSSLFCVGMPYSQTHSKPINNPATSFAKTNWKVTRRERGLQNSRNGV